MVIERKVKNDQQFLNAQNFEQLTGKLNPRVSLQK
jgi:hypothetical protein